MRNTPTFSSNQQKVQVSSTIIFSDVDIYCQYLLLHNCQYLQLNNCQYLLLHIMHTFLHNYIYIFPDLHLCARKLSNKKSNVNYETHCKLIFLLRLLFLQSLRQYDVIIRKFCSGIALMPEHLLLEMSRVGFHCS